MKILLLTLEYPPMRGGVASYLKTLVAYAHERDTIRVHVPPKNEHWIKTALSLDNKGEDANVIIVSHAIPMGYCALLRGKPYVCLCHGTDILTARRSPWKMFFFRYVLRHANLLVANSKFTATLLSEEGFKDVPVVYPPVALTVRAALASDRAEILSVGRLVPRKGFDTVIRAMPEVIKKIPNAHLTIVGNGPSYEELDALAHELRVENFVNIVTDANDAERDEFYRDANLFVLAARQSGTDVEGFGMVIMEASAAGLPVIVGNSGGAAEAVIDGKTGILFDPADVSKLAPLIIGLLNDNETAKRLGGAGAAFAAEFSPEKTAQNFWRLIHQKID